MNDELFDIFWDAGLRKAGSKKKARKAFDRAIKESGMTGEVFTRFVVADIRERKALNQYGFDRLHPSTYLNGERWEDELIDDTPKLAPPTRADMSPMQQLTDTSWADGMIDTTDSKVIAIQ